MVFVADLFDGFILPFLNLPLFSKFKRQSSDVIDLQTNRKTCVARIDFKQYTC
jgi:hypothetical protein